MSTTNTKRLSPQQRAKIVAQQDAVQAAAAAEAFEWPTIKAYRMWCARFGTWLCLHASDAQRAALPAEKIRDYLRWIADGRDNGRRKSATTLKQARHGLLFLYQKVRREEVGDIGLIPVAKRPQLLPDVRTPEEVARVIAAVQDSPAHPYRLILRLLYCTGGRINDVLRLRLKDIDWKQCMVVFRAGKGRKDGRVTLPHAIMAELRAQCERAFHIHRADRAAGIPTELPDPVFNKSMRYGFAWGWAYVFPAAKPGRHPTRGIINRWHTDPRYLQREVRRAAESVGLEGVLTPHKLRHVYATELLTDGVDIRTVQELLRHQNVKTTEIYTHTAISAPGTLAAINRHAARIYSGSVLPFPAAFQPTQASTG